MGMGTTSISTQAVGLSLGWKQEACTGLVGYMWVWFHAVCRPLGLGIKSRKSCGLGVGPAGLGWYKSRAGAGQK